MVPGVETAAEETIRKTQHCWHTQLVPLLMLVPRPYSSAQISVAVSSAGVLSRQSAPTVADTAMPTVAKTMGVERRKSGC